MLIQIIIKIIIEQTLQFANSIFRLCEKYYWPWKTFLLPHFTPSFPATIIMDEFAQSPKFFYRLYIFQLNHPTFGIKGTS